MPKQFLKRVQRSGFGEFLFYDWAKEPDWELPVNPILVTGENFGCGSSREHAPWGLQDYGFEAIIAPSFGDIFFQNCLKIGLLPVRLDADVVAGLRGERELAVDLERCVVETPSGRTIPFELDAFQRECLLNGLDEIGLTLEHADEIAAFDRGRSSPFSTLTL